MRAFATLGIEVAGFRPPGGALTPRSPSLLRQAGLEWCSPAGGGFGVDDGLAYVPFDWRFVDAYHLMARFGSLRVTRGDPAQALEPEALVQRLVAELDALAAGGGEQTLILHPFLMVGESWWAGVRQLLERIRELVDEGRLSVLAGGEFAQWLRGASRGRARARAATPAARPARH